jgi:putative salt-induced outer membrane protein
MTHVKLLAGTAIAAFAFASTASAQFDPRPPLSPVQEAELMGIDREAEDIELRTQREIARAEDRARFGLGTVPQGTSGSVSLTGFANWGNSDDVAIGGSGRLNYGAGNVAHAFGLTGTYSERGDDEGDTRILGLYDLNVGITEQFYGFGIVRGDYRRGELTEGEGRQSRVDVFAGVGPGFQVINTPDVAWRVQAGPGYRFTRDPDGNREHELGAIASSRATFRVTQDMFVTNDTDLLWSDDNTLVSNDLALNTRLAGPLSARVSLRTDWRSDTAPNEDSTDNSLSLGVVYSFQ